MHQDFFGQNLRGRSFKGQNLEGANFSGTDIKSADFTGANLNGANFTSAKAGLQKRWAIFLVCVSWVLSGISGFFSAFTGLFITFIFDSPHPLNQVVGWTSLIVVIVLFIVILDQGLKSALAVTLAFAVAFANACPLVSRRRRLRLSCFHRLSYCQRRSWSLSLRLQWTRILRLRLRLRLPRSLCLSLRLSRRRNFI